MDVRDDNRQAWGPEVQIAIRGHPLAEVCPTSVARRAMKPAAAAGRPWTGQA
jgi:hypothetical protein